MQRYVRVLFLGFCLTKSVSYAHALEDSADNRSDQEHGNATAQSRSEAEKIAEAVVKAKAVQRAKAKAAEDAKAGMAKNSEVSD